ncbi:MAG: hypothetical protein HOV77_32875 [Hamadaea sp.]|uniref:hypothetical protein n=1 Tax=Hamadaea sp. TaxID=2024425 RepID=UPI0017B80B48|nr:hypothetical protein [Hamadaea sp.]NUT23977.1 hypothetical protein [Hamadaea sp.]
MAFPEDRLPIKVELRLGSTWTDFSSRVRHEQKIRIRRGRSDWGEQVDRSTCAFTMDNNDGALTPRNPAGAYYGQIGRNTPCRVSVMTGETYLDLPGTSTLDYAETPDAAALDITGDLDVRFDVSLANWIPPVWSGATVEMIGKFGFTGQKSWFLGTRLGRLYFEWSADGTNSLSASSTIAPTIPGPGGRMAVRVTLDVNNGAGGNTVTFYTAATLDGPWVQLGDPVTQVGTTSIFNSTASLRIGNATSFTFTPPLGRAHAAEVRNGISGTVVANPNFAAQTVGAASFADSAGRTWTMSGNSQLTNRRTRFVGEVSSWSTRWETKHDVVCNVEASGIMRRLSQGVSPARSPMYREFTNAGRTGIISYWPMEDESGASRFASGMDGQAAMAIPSAGGVTPAAYSGWKASAPLPTYSFGTTRVTVAPYTATSYVFTRFFAAVPAAGVTSTDRLFTIGTTGSARSWAVWINTAGNLDLRAYDADGTQIIATGFDPVAINGKNVQIGVELTQNGANIDATLFVWYVDESSLEEIVSDGVATTLAANTLGAATEVRFGFSGLLNGTALGHLTVASSNSAFADTIGAMVAWAGEATSERLYRLGEEELTPCFAASISEEKMGPQGLSPILDLMREAADADEGILHESRDWYPAFRFRDRPSLYNQAPALTLDYTGSDGLVTPLDPVDDDQAVRNDRTVVRSGGSSTRRTLDTGTLSTQVPPNGVGRYDDSQTRSLYEDAQTGEHAGWLLHLGTWDETRYSKVRVDLAAAPHMIEAATSVDIGDRMDIANPPSWLPPDLIKLMAQGYDEVFDQFTWTIDFNCTPYGPWHVAVEALGSDGVYDRADTDGCVLVEDLTSSETAVDVRTTTGPVWVQAAPSLITNYDFETDLSGWTGNGCTAERGPTPGNAPFGGSWSLKLTPDGVAEFPNVGATMRPVVEGRDYTLSGWQMSEVTRSVDLNLNWFDAGGAYLSTSANGLSLTADVWTWFEITATAPAGAAFANGSPTVPDFPPVTDILWSDMITLRPALANELPQEFPYEVRVGGEVMLVDACTSAIYDTFDRTTASGWGTAESGGAWTVVGTAADYSTAPNVGSVAQPATGIAHLTLQAAPSADVDLVVDCAVSALATGASLFTGPIVRAADNNNLYTARVDLTTANAVVLTLRKRVGGVETQLGSTYTTAFTHVAGTYYRVRLQAFGSTIRTKVWRTTDVEPDVWRISVTDTDLTAAANIGTRSFRNTGNTNAGLSMRFQNFELINPQTMTVVRSVNGVTKTHTSGAAVALAHPAYTSL